MTRYAAVFERCREDRQGALGAFLMLGDPGIVECEAYLDALVEGGTDMVELGIPFSDPIADGPVIQAAGVRALEAGVRSAHCLAMIARFRARHPLVPVGILTYANIVAARGIGRFAGELADAGADSLLVADVPTLEAEPYVAAARAAGIDPVLIAAPNTPRPTLERIARLGSGYTYCVARPGVTGADQRLKLDHRPLFAALAEAGAAPPVLGFGIARPEQVAEGLAHGAAGVITGSALVERVARRESPAELAGVVAALKAATVLDFATAAP
jgi:tryptophan synthase alpha chain